MARIIDQNGGKNRNFQVMMCQLMSYALETLHNKLQLLRWQFRACKKGKKNKNESWQRKI